MRGQDPSVLLDSLVLTATVDGTIEMLTSNQNIAFNFEDDANVVASIDPRQLPLSVETTRGTAGAPFYVSGIAYADNAAVAVTSVGTTLASANANRKSLQFANIGTDSAVIVATGITKAKDILCCMRVTHG